MSLLPFTSRNLINQSEEYGMEKVMTSWETRCNDSFRPQLQCRFILEWTDIEVGVWMNHCICVMIHSDPNFNVGSF